MDSQVALSLSTGCDHGCAYPWCYTMQFSPKTDLKIFETKSLSDKKKPVRYKQLYITETCGSNENN